PRILPPRATVSHHVRPRQFPLVFFQRSPTHAALHSFPTRRSSDLGSRPSGAGTAGSGSSGRRSTLSGSTTPHGGCASRRSTPSRDRKSTRLNSSHVAISYAVFCLKKKN